MTWRPTAALARGVVVAGVVPALALAAARPALVVLAAPFAVWVVCALRRRPREVPRIGSSTRGAGIREGRAVRTSALLQHAEDGEHVVRSTDPAPYVAMDPPSGTLGALVDHRAAVDGVVALPEVVVRPDRWGRVSLGEEQVCADSAWGGFRWGPQPRWGTELRVLPQAVAYHSRAALPSPSGLVGAHRSARIGSGVELGDVREFAPGDRLRRIHWPVSSRSGRLHVTAALAEQDAGVLLVVDAFADHGESGGVDGPQSSLDLTVRAAAALAAHHLRGGDRVALRVLGRPGLSLPSGGGRRQLRRVEVALASVAAGDAEPPGTPLRLGAAAGSFVVVLSALLDDRVAAVAAATQRRGLSVLVVDCLPPGAAPVAASGVDARVVEAAWRLRLLDRERVLSALEGAGCPTAAWRGPGSLDGVLSALGRRARAPRVRT